MNDTFMKERPVFPLILSMAMPMVISMLVNSLYNIVDSFFVAQISEDAMTALSLVFPVQNFSNAIAIGFGIGISSQIAICLGAGNKETAGKAATHGLVLFQSCQNFFLFLLQMKMSVALASAIPRSYFFLPL